MPRIGVATAGDPPTVRTVDRFEDSLPPVIEDGPKFEGTDVSIENLFNYRKHGFNLYVFLRQFPPVSKEQALAEIHKSVRENAAEVIDSARGYIGGTPRFTGTRVPLGDLFDYMAGGYGLEEFLSDFPTVERDRAIKTLAAARYALESIAYESAAGSDRDKSSDKETPARVTHKPKFRNPPIKRRKTPPKPPPRLREQR